MTNTGRPYSRPGAAGSRAYAHICAKIPATPDLFLVAPNTRAVNVSLSMLPDTPEVRAATELEVRDWFVSDRP